MGSQDTEKKENLPIISDEQQQRLDHIWNGLHNNNKTLEALTEAKKDLKIADPANLTDYEKGLALMAVTLAKTGAKRSSDVANLQENLTNALTLSTKFFPFATTPKSAQDRGSS